MRTNGMSLPPPPSLHKSILVGQGPLAGQAEGQDRRERKEGTADRDDFQSAALKTHPDRVPADSPERAARTRKFQLVNDAYYTLSDDARRRDYDAQRKLFASASTPDDTDPFEEADEEIPRQPGANPFSWAWNYFNGKQGGGAAAAADREQTENAQFSDVFEEMMREEGMAEDGTNRPTNKFWSVVGGLSGGALGFIVANVPGLVAGAVAGNRLGAVRDAKGKSVYAVFMVSLQVMRRILMLTCLTGAAAGRSGQVTQSTRHQGV